MPLKNYGLLTGKLIDHGPQHGGNPHYLLMIHAGVIPYSVALNVESTQAQGDHPSPLQYQVLDNLAGSKLAESITNKSSFVLRDADPSCPSLDFVHDGLLNMNAFKPIPPGAAAQKNPFYKSVVAAAAKAKVDVGAFVAVFGTGYPDQDDRPAGPGRNPLRAAAGFSGVDNVHMNQGSFYRVGTHTDPHFLENGPHQDGAVIFFFSDKTVVGFFAKFEYQDSQTNEFGNPTHTGVDKLDSLKAISSNVRRKLLKPRTAAAKAARPSKTAKVTKAARLKPDRTSGGVSANGQGASAPEVPVAGTSGGQAAPGFSFADTVTIVDPNRTFDVDDDSNYRNSAFVNNFAMYGTPEPVPGPRGGVYPIVKLEDIVGGSAVAAIKARKKIVFHSVGDTGAPVKSQSASEDSVANLMLEDFAPGVLAADQPTFFFHLGDVVYYYGEDEFYYDQFYHPYKDYPRPILAIPGNHDGITHPDGQSSLHGFISAFCDDKPRYWSESGGILRTTMNQPGVYFTLDAPFVSIIGLYSNCSETYGYLDDQQKLFLLSELRRLKPLRENGSISAVLLAVHHCPMSFSVSKPASAAMRQVMDVACQQADFWPDAVFSGHAHIYQRMTRLLTVDGQPRQMPHFIAGSGGYANNPKQEINKKDMATQDISDKEFRLHNFLKGYGYLLVSVTPGKPSTLRVEFHSPDINNGLPADTCVLNLDTHQIM
jgi:uncharacterized protein YukJ